MRALLNGLLTQPDVVRLLAEPVGDDPGEQQLLAVAGMVVGELADAAPGERAAVLEFAARRSGAVELADLVRAARSDRPFEVDWARWTEIAPHLRLDGHRDTVNSMQVARQGGRQVLVSASNDGTMRVWDLATGAPDGEPLIGHRGPVASLAVALLDGRTVVISGGADRTVRLWDLATRRPLGSPLTGHPRTVARLFLVELADGPAVVAHSTSVEGIDVDDHGEPLSADGDEPKGRDGYALWDLSPLADGSGAEPRLLGTVGEPPTILHVIAAAAYRGRPMLVAVNLLVAMMGLGGEQEVVVSDLLGEEGTDLRLADLEPGAWAVVDGRRTLLVHQADELLMVDVETGDQRSLPTAWVSAVGDTSDGPVLADLDRDTRTLTLRSVAGGRELGAPLLVHPLTDFSVRPLVAEVGGRPVVVTADPRGELRVWSPTLESPFSPGPDRPGGADGVAGVRVNGRPAVVSSHGYVEYPQEVLHRRDAVTGRPLGPVLRVGRGTDVLTVVEDPDGAAGSLIVAGNGCVMQLFDVATGEALGEPVPVQERRSLMVFRPAATFLDDRPVLVAPGDDHTVRVWDLLTGAPVGAPLIGHTDGVTVVALVRLEGRRVIVSSGIDATLRLWDLATGEPLGHVATGHANWVSALAATVLDGRPVAVTGGADGRFRTWDLASALPLGDPVAAQESWLGALAVVAPGGRPAAATGGPRCSELTVWDLATGRRRATVHLDGGLLALSALADDTLAVGSTSGLAVLRLLAVPD